MKQLIAFYGRSESLTSDAHIHPWLVSADDIQKELEASSKAEGKYPADREQPGGASLRTNARCILYLLMTDAPLTRQLVCAVSTSRLSAILTLGLTVKLIQRFQLATQEAPLH